MSAVAAQESIGPEGRFAGTRARIPELPGSLPTLAAGVSAVYPGLGPCRICRVVTREVNGRAMMFYQLSVMDDRGGDLFVPVEKALAIGVRLLMKRSEIPELMAQLKNPAKSADNWKQRANDNLKLLGSGSPFDLAMIVASLTRLQEHRTLTLGESGTLGRARRLLVCEISEVTGETRKTAEERVDQALNTGITMLRLNDSSLIRTG